MEEQVKAYYAITDVGPWRAFQVVLLDPDDGWTRTGYLRLLEMPPRDVVRAMAAPHLAFRVVLDD